MDFVFRRSYRGPIRAAIFDWAGTTVDFGCLAPAGAFITLFERHGVEAAIEQARGPMGMHKRDHIRVMLEMPELARQWTAVHGAAPGEGDVERLFEEFIPLQLEALPPYCEVIPGIVEAVDELRARGIRIGATTGYNREMMSLCMEGAAKAGYAPEVSVAVTDVPAGRPAPWMAVQAMMTLGVHPFEAGVKIGDTVTDVQEGLNCGMWTVGVTETGNEMGVSREELAALPSAERARRRARAGEKLAQAGAHYVIAGPEELPGVIDAINRRLASGERP